MALQGLLNRIAKSAFLSASILVATESLASDCLPPQPEQNLANSLQESIELVQRLANEDKSPNKSGWLTRLVSVYRDDSSNGENQKVAVEGTGFTVAMINCGDSGLLRYFIVTSSHVSQGEALLVDQKNGKSPEILGRLADNLQDLEVIEIKEPVGHIFGFYSPVEMKKGTFDANNRWLNEKAMRVSGRAWEAFSTFHRPRNLLFMEVPTALPLIMLDQSTKFATERVFIPAAEWLSDVPRNRDFEKTPKTSLRRTVGSNEFAVDAEVGPRTSGSPVIRELNFMGEKRMLVDGVMSRRIRGFDTAYFISDDAVFDLLSEYCSGKRGKVDPNVTWRYASPYATYRGFGKDTLEISHFSQKLGGGLSSDGGGGLSSDGGGGSKAVSAVNLPAGITWEGKPSYGFNFVLKDRDGKQVVAPIYGDTAAISLLRNKPDLPFSLIETKEDLLPLLKNRLGVQEDSFTLVASESSRPEESPVLIRAEKGGLRLSIPSKGIDLELDAQGRPKSSPGKAFSPIIEVKSPANGKTLLIDLHELFFVDLTLIPQNFKAWPRKEGEERILANVGVPVIRYRNGIKGKTESIQLKLLK